MHLFLAETNFYGIQIDLFSMVNLVIDSNLQFESWALKFVVNTFVKASTSAVKWFCETDAVAFSSAHVYLASGAGRDVGKQEDTIGALTRGYTHWGSGRISQIEVNLENPMYCYVCSTMSPSMKQGNYHMAVARKEWRFCNGTFSHLWMCSWVSNVNEKL